MSEQSSRSKLAERKRELEYAAQMMALEGLPQPPELQREYEEIKQALARQSAEPERTAAKERAR